MIFENPATCISIYKDVFDPKDFIQKLEQSIENDEETELFWEYSRVGGGSGHLNKHRTSMSCMATSLLPPYGMTELSQIFRSEIYAPCIEVVNDYVEDHSLSGGSHELISILKYTGMAEYKAHHDHHPENKRVFSLVASLGTAEVGGELEFVNFTFSTKLDPGSVILFPSNFPYTHIAHPVQKGTKYSMVTWFQ
jgi:hypothetical protein